jgi:hypothetical protein
MCVFLPLIFAFCMICVTDKYVETKKELDNCQKQQTVEKVK